MCGIVGIISSKSIELKKVKSICDEIKHRGPDDAGYFLSKQAKYVNLTDNQFKQISPDLPSIEEKENLSELSQEDWNVFLGHRRLSIIDVTASGHQPMSDINQKIWLVFNGEIYNFKEIKAELISLGHEFKSSSDSEVLIYAYIQWGTNLVHKLNGMFAFAIYDRQENKLLLFRDRYGIKPLYYCFYENGDFGFASEKKALSKYDESVKKLDKEAMIEYFTFQNIFSDRTLYKDVKLLDSGHFIEIDIETLSNKSIKPTEYWDYSFEEPEQIKSKAYYQEHLDHLFQQAVNRQMISDVEVGSYLSGGMDSGSITAVAAKKFPYLKTFTVGFDMNSVSGLELAYDEREKSEYMSYLFKTEHYEMVLKSGDMERCLEEFTWHLEEPRVGQSYPNFYAAKLASKFVKVVLAGTGGDELFAGYPWRYYRAVNNTNFEDYIDKYYQFWQRLIPNSLLKKVFAPIYDDIKDVWTRDIFKNVFKHHAEKLQRPEDYINHSLYFEAKTFLNGLFIVEDKLSMAHSLETRVPFMDNDLVDFAMKIPVNYKLGNLSEVLRINENQAGHKTSQYFEKTQDGKLILRDVMKNYIPEKITSLVKQGFSSPDHSWFKGDSIDFVKNRILNKNARIYNIMDYKTVSELLNSHLSGKSNRRLLIWSLLNFEEWLSQNEF